MAQVHHHKPDLFTELIHGIPVYRILFAILWKWPSKTNFPVSLSAAQQ